ncbi:MAG: hypothetical protein ABJA02_02955 [Acidobacteriota bacterium]
MKIMWSYRTSLLICLVMLVIAGVVARTDAQTRHRRNSSPTVVPVATPTPVSNDAQVIRTADQNDPVTYVTPGEAIQTEPQTDPNAQKVKDLNARVRKLEAVKSDPYEEKQKRMLLNLDILTRAEQRSESLRKQLFDMIEKENSVKTRLDQIEYDSRPEMINRSAAFSGSMRPEELRDMRKKSLDAEKTNLQSLLTEIQSTKTSLTTNLDRSDALVEKLRARLETDIDDALVNDKPDQ